MHCEWCFCRKSLKKGWSSTLFIRFRQDVVQTIFGRVTNLGYDFHAQPFGSICSEERLKWNRWPPECIHRVYTGLGGPWIGGICVGSLPVTVDLNCDGNINEYFTYYRNCPCECILQQESCCSRVVVVFYHRAKCLRPKEGLLLQNQSLIFSCFYWSCT